MMVQRKDSMSYVEFVRGKYSLQNREYIIKLLSNMTQFERDSIRDCSFDKLWYGFWQSDHCRSFMKEYEMSCSRFDTLRNGYILRSAGSRHDTHPTLVNFDLQTALNASHPPLHDGPEWGFPKGRRNINESDLMCACREFREETGVEICDIHLLSNVKPFDEIFTGSNKVRYRHVYYLAHLNQRAATAAAAFGASNHRDVMDTMQSREISKVEWFDYDGVLQHIRDENIERREMFRRVHQCVLTNESCHRARS
jgi:ADP-ribose pyrophosphatase YjhB (NUDIX family)